jgi:putative restriction endonuclease
MARAPSVPWTRSHLLIALNLYCKLPFGSFDRDNSLVQQVAVKMGRTSNSLAMKLCNLASLDPVQRARGIRGLDGASRQDRDLWDEFHADIASLGPESEQLLHDLFTDDNEAELDLLGRDRVRIERPSDAARTSGVPSGPRAVPQGPTEVISVTRVRRGQQFFRQSVLNAYGIACCITGIRVPRLLVASHIRPWSSFPEGRLDLRNGLCLSTLHDAAFDSGLITLDEHLRIVLSPTLRGYLPQPSLKDNFEAFEGKPIRLPEKLAEPHRDYLDHHRTSVFQT